MRKIALSILLGCVLSCGDGAVPGSAPAPKPTASPKPMLRAAACARSITPVVGENHSDPIYIAGFGNDRQATGVHDDIWARGVILESRGKKIAMVVLDVVHHIMV